MSVLDRGLQYGDGLFETVAILDGEPRLWERHMARLRAGVERLALPPPPEAELHEEACRLSAGSGRAVLKILYTRGVGGRGFRPPEPARAMRILMRFEAPEYPAAWWSQGVDVRFCDLRLGAQPALAGLKHLNRLEQVLARAEWTDPAIAEGLLLDNNGAVIEGTQSNLFAVIGDRLLTPVLDEAGVAGVMRAWILEWAALFGLNWEEARLTRSDVLEARELFLTNSLIGVWPVRSLAGRRLPERGIARELIACLRAARLCLIPD